MTDGTTPAPASDGAPAAGAALDRLDHVAIAVTDIAVAVDWYRARFAVRVLYQDSSWALLGFANTALALVIPDQHPPHLAVERPDAAAFGPVKAHRDGTASAYVADPAGNTIEIMQAGGAKAMRPSA
ncbi:VOC family protein [Tistrella bauzanensis]|jgi:catechol 2,3-dioxygenase-like lactoylglutathione lyase family enzyme|uniref:VOC family protein n=1 Tax=Tistrella TaxID=171436 RepID=UPI0031F62383